MTNAFVPFLSVTAAAQFNEICRRRPQPLLERIHCVIGALNDYRDELREEERATVTGASAKRRLEYAAGRHFARQAILANGGQAAPIAKGDARQPLWPPGLTGSITHSSSVAWAAVASIDAGIRSLGIDLEQRNRLSPQINRKLFLPRELQAIEARGADFATWLFSAKEAIYKATNPLTGSYIGFTEAECVFEEAPGPQASGPQSAGIFTARYLGDDGASQIVATGRGYVKQDDEHISALFLIPGQ